MLLPLKSCCIKLIAASLSPLKSASIESGMIRVYRSSSTLMVLNSCSKVRLSLSISANMASRMLVCCKLLLCQCIKHLLRLCLALLLRQKVVRLNGSHAGLLQFLGQLPLDLSEFLLEGFV